MDLKIKTRKKKIISYLKEYFSGSKVDCGDNKISKFSKRCDKKKKKTGNRIQNRKAQKSNHFHYI